MTQVRAEFFRRLLEDEFMPEAMTADFVPGFLNIANKTGKTLRDPTEDEKRASHLMAFEQVQNAMRVGNDARFVPIPTSWINPIRKGLDMEVIFHIDRKNVCDICHIDRTIGYSSVLPAATRSLEFASIIDSDIDSDCN